MTREGEVPVTENKNEQDLKAAVQRLGENLKALGQQAWQSPERRQLQSDLEGVVQEAESAIESAGEEFRRSETGKRLLQDLQRMRDGFESGEMGQRMRAELVQIINRVNRELDAWLKSVDDDSGAGISEPGDGS